MAQVPLHMMRDTITIAKRYSIAGNDGVPCNVYSSSIIVQCYVQPLSANDALQYMRPTTTEQWRVYCAPTTTTGAAWDTTPEDQVIWNGTTYRIAGTPNASRGPDGNSPCVQFMMELYTA
jgi:hypothetical protein